MALWITLGVVAYLAIGILTGIRFLIARGKDLTSYWKGRIDVTAFDAEDELLTVAIILVWPGVWLLFAVAKFIISIEKYIVVPAVNKWSKQKEGGE